MLDAYIIERIRREQEDERRRGAVIPLHIEVPRRTPEARDEKQEDDDDHGTVIVDYQL